MKKQILFIQLIAQRFIQRSFIAAALSCCFPALFLVPLHAQDCTPTIEWQKSLGGDNSDRASSVLPTADGGYMVTGYTASNNGDVSGNHGEEDFWVVKLASDGSITWQIALGGLHEESAHAVIQDADGGYVIAGAARSNNGDVSGNHGVHDFWVVKLDAAGLLVWQSALGGSLTDIAYDIIQTNDGGYAVAGLTYSNDGQVTGNHGEDDYWVVKLDAGGILEWQKTLGGTEKDEAYSIRQTTDGGFIVAGYTASNDSDVTGNHGIADYWIVKLDATGNLSWQKALGGLKNDIANSIEQTTDGGYIVGGYSTSNTGDVSDNHGNTDVWVVKLDTAGSILWQKALGGASFDYGNATIQTADGGYATVGSSLSLDGDVTGNHGGSDFWTTKQDANGNLLWQKSLGGSVADSGFSIKQTPDYGFILAGFSSSNDDDVTGNHGLQDFWVVKLSADYGGTSTFYADFDDDGYGDADSSVTACVPPTGFVNDSTDCNDSNPGIHPDAIEICNLVDDDCNGTIDDGLSLTSYYLDADADGYGNVDSMILACIQPLGYLVDSTDCDDNNQEIHPGATEICNQQDDDCNGAVDDGLLLNAYYMDADSDGFGNVDSILTDCSQPSGYVTDSTDCDDTNHEIHPGATEICNNLDDDCNEFIDDGLPLLAYFMDDDDDGYGNADSMTLDCSPPPSYVSDSTDCNDTNPNINPGATEIPDNGIDENCDGLDSLVGIDDVESNNSLIIFPNPATDMIILQLQTNSTVKATIVITNVLGETVYEKTLTFTQGTLGNKISLDEKFSEGIYYVKIHNDQLLLVKPFIVIK